MRRTLPLTLLLSLAPLGCGPSQVYTDADIAKLPKLGDVMWSQAQAADPQFKKIGKASFTDGDYQEFTALANRLHLTTARIKSDFSKGPEFNQLADTLNQHATELADAAGAKDAARSSTALSDIKTTCKTCHSKFR